MARFRHQPSYKKELFMIGGIVMVFGTLVMSLFGPSGYRDLQTSRLELRARQNRVRALELDNYRRRKNIETLREDPEAQERNARKNGFARENEIIQRLEE